ncbi:acyl-CoA dehydrogenase family protein [Nocardiopsis sp. FIRDI 009]|uniref:acyl-CoA dehydrogenase family protein n=1 Tax=Nocardiopsis sp. FIRDI 009 TaxID=714197 RepID=UPI000E27646F|nr:acyl-CoA dehydrogenase family protein [Nocardiopsis sp. FIRDI 009]
MTTRTQPPARTLAGATPDEVRAECAELFHDDLNPVLRRIGDRPRGAGSRAAPAEDDTDVRASVWATLADMGVLSAALPAHLGGSEQAQRILVEVAELTGPGLYQSLLPDTLLAADLLARDGRHDRLLTEVADGRTTVALALRDRGADEPDAPGALEVDRDHGTVTGSRRFVPFAADADLILAVGAVDGAMHACLVPVDQPGVGVRRQDDLGRGDLYGVSLDRAALAPDGLVRVDRHYASALARARLRHAAYLSGLCRGALDLTVAHLKERVAFGRPLAGMQAPAHRLAALSAENAALLALVRRTARVADSGTDGIVLHAVQAALLANDLARTVSAEAVHLHGALGMTERCDASFFYRRAAVDAPRFGTGTGLRKEAARLLRAAHNADDPGRG